METIPPGFHPSLPYQQVRRRGSEGEGLIGGGAHSLDGATDSAQMGQLRSNTRQMPWKRVLEARATHFRQRPRRGQEGRHTVRVPEGTAVAWPDNPASMTMLLTRTQARWSWGLGSKGPDPQCATWCRGAAGRQGRGFPASSLQLSPQNAQGRALCHASSQGASLQ